MSISGVLLDTNVASYLLEGSVESARYRQLIRGLRLYLSVISVGELRFGAVKDNWGDTRRATLESFVDNATVVSVDSEIASVVAVVMNRCRRKGRRMDWNDAWIAATAIFHGLPLVTHDRDFLGVERLEVITALRGLEIREPAVARAIGPETTAEAAMEWLRRYLETLEGRAEAVV
jgi:tRNA(fMet)-specific endonuclease VapC